ncbi:hypothetical protein ACT8ZV_01650 [Nocardioides sp. MAHUQ-72]|uniref:hypothetical protein n=1 Tax=unclassified Nocardioides TaxID=2615069 RepID=UPI00360F93A2
MSFTRGPLPARVYWRRRLLVLGTALLLVFAFARLLGAGSDASSDADEAAQVAADRTTAATDPTGTATSTASDGSTGGSTGKPGKHHSSKAPVLAEPDGPCADSDIAVTPDVEDAVAGRDVTIVLELRTIESEACTWQASRNSLTLKIWSGKDDIWTSRQCPRAIPTNDLVVRRDTSARVAVTWNGKRSDDECSRLTEWALPGFYHVEAAALAGEPDEVQFELETPTAPVITRTPTPHQAKNSGRPVASPSGSAH